MHVQGWDPYGLKAFTCVHSAKLTQPLLSPQVLCCTQRNEWALLIVLQRTHVAKEKISVRVVEALWQERQWGMLEDRVVGLPGGAGSGIEGERLQVQ